MKILFMLLFLLSDNKCADPSFVYICNSTGAKKYHLKEDCRGLRNCQHRVVKMTLEEAKKRGKTLCGWEK
jgi:hypothetical protein